MIDRVEGRIERRVLVNLRVDPEAAAATLPTPFRPLTVGGWAVAGMCLIRLADLRPVGVPARWGLTSENVALRTAVEWDDEDGPRTGVWIPNRFTSSRLTTAVGGRLFPAIHSRVDIAVADTREGIHIDVTRDRSPRLAVRAAPATGVPAGSVFGSMDEARAFFQAGATGVAPSRRRGLVDVVELVLDRWHLEPLELLDAHAAPFERRWPIGSVAEWDSAFVMRDVGCRWRATTRPLPDPVPDREAAARR